CPTCRTFRSSTWPRPLRAPPGWTLDVTPTAGSGRRCAPARATPPRPWRCSPPRRASKCSSPPIASDATASTHAVLPGLSPLAPVLGLSGRRGRALRGLLLLAGLVVLIHMALALLSLIAAHR